MRSSLGLFTFALLSGCAARSREPAEPVAPPRAAAPAVTATASVAPPVPSPPPAPSPEELAAKRAEKEAAIREVERRVEQELAEAKKHPEPPRPPEPYSACDQPHASPSLAACNPGKRAGSCRECPSYASFNGPGTQGRVDLLLRGSFSGPYEEALLVVGGCEPHANYYGGLLLTRKVEGGWVKVAYLAGIVPQSCDVGPKVEGASRIACHEIHGMNGGTYETQATLIDFRTRRVDVLLGAACEDGFDVEAVRWAGAARRELQVSVSYGLRRSNDGQGCVDVGGKKRRAALSYAEAAGEFTPTPAAQSQLLGLTPSNPDHALDPTVADATGGTGSSRRVPPELLPVRTRQVFDEPNCMEP